MSITEQTYTFDPIKKVLTRSEKPDPNDPNFTVTTKINLKNSTVQYNNDPATPLTDAEFFVFLDILYNVKTTPALVNALLQNEYYTKKFLNTLLGRFNTPIKDKYFQFFPSFILPYEALYRELWLRPKYAKKILEAYDKNNSVFIRRLKQSIRRILIVPGIFISPFIIFSVGLILKNQS